MSQDFEGLKIGPIFRIRPETVNLYMDRDIDQQLVGCQSVIES